MKSRTLLLTTPHEGRLPGRVTAGVVPGDGVLKGGAVRVQLMYGKWSGLARVLCLFVDWLL